MSKTAVVLFNLGGPDSPEAVQPFLFNLFKDRAIIDLPTVARWPLAKLISWRRASVAEDIYRRIGGKSPLLELTREQAKALESRLSGGARVFVAMRYWHPMSKETAAAVKMFVPDDVVLLPLYPQFSTTTTGSSLAAWRRAARAAGLDVPTFAVCCYGEDGGFIDAHTGLLQAAHQTAAAAGPPRVLFSAHGLPKKIVARGDPYQRQIERTAKRIVDASGLQGLDWTICYQSRVGPLEWIGPSTEEELRRAGRDRVPVVVVPISFVSEHSETLVELDILYRELAERAGVPKYVRVPALGTNPAFIRALARLVGQARAAKRPVGPGAGAHACEQLGACPIRSFDMAAAR